MLAHFSCTFSNIEDYHREKAFGPKESNFFSLRADNFSDVGLGSGLGQNNIDRVTSPLNV